MTLTAARQAGLDLAGSLEILDLAHPAGQWVPSGASGGARSGVPGRHPAHRRVSELIDWLVDQDLRQWQALAAQLAERGREHGERRLGGDDIGAFQTDRRTLLDSVGRQAQRVVETFDRRAEAQAPAAASQVNARTPLVVIDDIRASHPSQDERACDSARA